MGMPNETFARIIKDPLQAVEEKTQVTKPGVFLVGPDATTDRGLLRSGSRVFNHYLPLLKLAIDKVFELLG
jgi:hypothetical protein